MNAVEIEQAVSELAASPYDPIEFPYSFLLAFGNKETTISRLRSGAMNKSDVGGVLQTNNIHIATAPSGEVSRVMGALRASPATTKAKAQFILSTDGEILEAEELSTGEVLACSYGELPDHFGFFLPLAGISTVKQIRESSFDIRATSRLNRLYLELLKDNPDWAKPDKRPAMNHFMARLIFSFFAEDTHIFPKEGLFTSTIDQMSARDSSNTHQIIAECFRAMNTKKEDRQSSGLPRWTDSFPYVNGGLFAGDSEVPRFSKIARTYLITIGQLDWTKINPDIFGSMIQAVADDEERGALGMHYTSVPNILKVLNPLFLDDLREAMAQAGDNPRLLLALRKRLSRIRVFDPACGSGNFLVIAYKEMRAIEAEINQRRGEPDRATDLPLTNFRGIELREFPAEVARLALIIAEFQCDVVYRGERLALDSFLPLDSKNWITCGNALRLDWLALCPPTGTQAQVFTGDLFSAPEHAAEVDFQNEGGETYICGNPPYLGSQWQDDEQKSALGLVFENYTKQWKSLDYVAGWFMKAAQYGKYTDCVAAFVSTNSICQGRQVATLWPMIFDTGHQIVFAHTSFKWANLASHNAGVTVAIVGISRRLTLPRRIFSEAADKGTTVRTVENVNPYLIPGPNVIIKQESKPLNRLSEMSFGNMPNDGGFLLISPQEAEDAVSNQKVASKWICPFVGSQEFIRGLDRRCIWIRDEEYEEADQNSWLHFRFEAVRLQRNKSDRPTTRALSEYPFRFGEVRQSGDEQIIVIPRVSSENRDYLPVGLLKAGYIVGDRNFALFDAPIWNMALIASRLHWVWIGTVCVRMRTDFSYSNTLGWNTFPVPTLTEKNKDDLTRCAEDILLAREAHFPATIADLYEPDAMPEDLRRAHERNDEVLERIYIGRKFRNDTERLEKLFELYTKMTAKKGAK